MAENGTKKSYITVYQAMSGWKAVQVWWNPEGFAGGDGFWEPWQTGVGTYQTREEAVEEARSWAESEGLECRA